MSVEQATSLGSWTLLIAQSIESYGLDAEKIFLDAGIEFEALRRPNSRIPTALMNSLWQRVISETNDPYFSLKVAAHYQPSAFSALGMALAASRHVGDALCRASRYSQIISDGSNCLIEDEQDSLSMRVSAISPLKAPPNIYGVEALFAVLFKLLQSISNDKLQARSVSFQHDCEHDLGPYESYFGCELKFSADVNRLEFAKTDIYQEQAFANSTLTNTLDEWIENHLSSLERELLSTRVKKQV